jgi:serine/threonine protein kinase
MFNTGTNIRDYKILSRIGEGGMGSIYLAEDEMLGRKIALKVLNPILSQDEQLIERFKLEAKVQASLIHPNIVTLHSFFREGTNYVMVMEYAEGKSIKQLIADRGAIEEEATTNILLQILEGLGFAHQSGVVHRDIKPSNIMVDGNNNIKIMDFGIAKVLGDKGLTRTGTKMGTVYYMSPEQIKTPQDIDQRTDIYSLGITLYEMLTGKLPYITDTESDFIVMNEIVNNAIEDPRKINPKLSETIVKVIMKMTNKERGSRYRTCYQVGVDLRWNEGNNSKYVNANSIISDEVLPKEEFAANFEKKGKRIKELKLTRQYKNKSSFLTVGWINSIAFSPSGEYIAYGSQNNYLVVLSLPNCTPIWESDRHTSNINSVAFSPHGQILASGSADKTIKLWRINDGFEIETLVGHTDYVTSVAFSPDGQTLASGSADKSIKIWRISLGRIVQALDGHTDFVNSVAFSPDGQTLASGSADKTVKLWSISDGHEIQSLKEHIHIVTSIALSPDGQMLASGSMDHTIKLWSISDGLVIQTLKGHTDYVDSVAFSPDGQTLASGSADKTIRLWRVSDGLLIQSLNAHTDGVTSIAFSSDGKTLASGGNDSILNLWEIINED